MIKIAFIFKLLFAVNTFTFAESNDNYLAENESLFYHDKIALQISPEKKQQVVEKINAVLPDGLQIEKKFAIEGEQLLILTLNSRLSYAQKRQILQSAAQELDFKHLPYAINEQNVHRGVLPKIYVKPDQISVGNEIFEYARKLGWVAEQQNNLLPEGVYALSNQEADGFSIIEHAILIHLHASSSWAEPAYFFYPDVHDEPNDPLFFRQWAIHNTGTNVQGFGTPGADISGLQAWSITRGSGDIKTAILDSGVDTLHPDMMQNLLPGFDGTGGESKGFPNTNYSQDGHGTACAGIVAAVTDNEIGIAGVCPECMIIPIKTFYYIDSLFGVIPFSTSTYMTKSITWAWKYGEADILSNSWGLPPLMFSLLPGDPAVVEAAIAEAREKGRGGLGTIQVFSSGNDGAPPIWPSNMPETIAVNATSMCDEKKSLTSCDGESWAGNFGETLNISAPGVRMPTTDMTGGQGYVAGNYYNSFNGTSAACPVVAAVAGLVLSIRPDLSVEEVEFILYQTADRVGDYAYDQLKFGGSWSKELGHGRVNAYEALKKAQDFEGISSVTTIQRELDFQVYPNPFNDKLNIKFPVEVNLTHVELYNMTGQLVYQKRLHEVVSSIQFKVEGFKSGTYLLRIMTDNGAKHRLILVR